LETWGAEHLGVVTNDIKQRKRSAEQNNSRISPEMYQAFQPVKIGHGTSWPVFPKGTAEQRSSITAEHGCTPEKPMGIEPMFLHSCPFVVKISASP
jgi:hypothetical protein